jgi:uncharacterized damage-inducible protein DinB
MSAINIVTREITLNTKLLNNGLDGISDSESILRLDGKGNHMRWLAGHLTGIRYRFVKRLGGQIEDYPHTDKYVLKDVPVPPNARALDPTIDYPTLKETLEQWNKASEIMIAAIGKLSEAQLNAESPFSPPFGGNTVLDSLAFLPLHEFYHIGQMSLIRTILGHKPLSFK